MWNEACTEDEFISLWHTHRSAAALSRILDVDLRMIHRRRRAIEARRGIVLACDDPRSPFQVTYAADQVRTNVEIEDGIVIVSSDEHYWPGVATTAHRALVTAIRELKPKMYISNGDSFDGAAAGRHGRIMWEKKPSVKQELDAVIERKAEVEEAANGCPLHWNWGNHDQRFNSKLSAFVPEFEGVQGFNLADHFPRWKFSMSVMINDHTIVKHRWHNGIHAAYNNVMKSGLSMVTGHLHALQVRPYTDYRGTRYAVDTGTLAMPDGEQFTYGEDNPANHRSGFAVLTFHNGRLMPPELLEVVDEDAGLICFRGQVVAV